VAGHTLDPSAKGDTADTITINGPNQLSFAKGGSLTRTQ
jgi:hypothetical protein